MISTDLPMHQSAMKELMISIIYTSYLDISFKKHSTIRLKCMDSRNPEISIILTMCYREGMTEKCAQELVEFKKCAQ
jgi:hypothetical protein